MATKGPHPRLSPEALAELYAHAARTYPEECCGIVFGPKAEPIANRPKVCENIQNELHAHDPAQFSRDARTAYNFDAADLFALQKSLRTDQPAKIIYHSHNDVGAYFSDTDQAAATMDGEPAYGGIEYVVVDCRADGAKGAAQFAWDEELRKYVEVMRY